MNAFESISLEEQPNCSDPSTREMESLFLLSLSGKKKKETTHRASISAILVPRAFKDISFS